MRIIEDWNDINNAVYDGSYVNKYRIGDKKDLCGEDMVVTSVGRNDIDSPYLEFKSAKSDLTLSMF